MEQRPLKDLSEQELITLWQLTNELNAIGQKELEEDLRGRDFCTLRAVLLAQIKLCQQYKIPYPELNEKSFSMKNDVQDIEDDYPSYSCADGFFQYFQNFCDIDGIGDFEVEELEDPFVLCKLLKAAGVGCDEESWENGLELKLSEKGADYFRELPCDAFYSEEAREDFFDRYADSLAIPEYLDFVDYLYTYFGYDEWNPIEVDEVLMVRSRSLANVLMERQQKGSEEDLLLFLLRDFCQQIVNNTCIGLYFSDGGGRIGGRIKDSVWSGLGVIFNDGDSSGYVTVFHKYTNLRVGAYIVQELAARLAAA